MATERNSLARTSLPGDREPRRIRARAAVHERVDLVGPGHRSILHDVGFRPARFPRGWERWDLPDVCGWIARWRCRSLKRPCRVRVG
jgi:hypothetical protein